MLSLTCLSLPLIEVTLNPARMSVAKSPGACHPAKWLLGRKSVRPAIPPRERPSTWHAETVLAVYAAGAKKSMSNWLTRSASS